MTQLLPRESPASAAAVSGALTLVESELNSVVHRLAKDGADNIARVALAVEGANRVFIFGLGRTGLALRMIGMRLMHLGLTVHIVGDTTTPAIRPGDVLLAASGSGTTGGILRAVTSATDAGAEVVAITTDPRSPLARESAVSIIIPAAPKLDRSAALSHQYAGSLFEQAALLAGDAIFHMLWIRSGLTSDELWPRHANLE